jgi:hypothetical protein
VALISLLALLLGNSLFVVDASTEAKYNVDIPRDLLREYVDDIGLFARNMPGVVHVEPLGDNRYRYLTEKEIPLAGRMQTEFIIQKSTVGDSVTIYRSDDLHAENYMSCRVRLLPASASQTSIVITLRIRLSRQNPTEVHWLAPILGEDFITNRIKVSLEDMLQEFIANSNRELLQRHHGQATTR